MTKNSISVLSSCTKVQKRSILKIAMDFVKADNRIHSEEVAFLENLRESLGLSTEEVDLIHYTTLSDAVSVIKGLDEEKVSSVNGNFNSIMRVDSDIDFEENLLYAAVTLSLMKESSSWAEILSIPTPDIDIPERQIVFLEKDYSGETHRFLDDRYDNLLISKAFGDIGLEMFYLPDILRNLGISSDEKSDSSGRFSLLSKSLSYLVPTGKISRGGSIPTHYGEMDSSLFFKVVCSRLGLTGEEFPFRTFLMVKVRSGAVLDDESAIRSSSDFFCLDISSDVKHRILSFVSLFDGNRNQIPYEGYYRILFDHFSSEAKLNSEILLDSAYDFTLPSLGGKKIVFKSSPQSRTLYLLLLLYGKDGISQETFEEALRFLRSLDKGKYTEGESFDMESFLEDLLSGEGKWREIIYNTVKIYEALSSKETDRQQFLSYIESILSHRSTLKNYLNKGFMEVDSLANKDMYLVNFDRDTSSYSVGIGLTMFLIQGRKGDWSPLSESPLWRTLLREM